MKEELDQVGWIFVLQWVLATVLSFVAIALGMILLIPVNRWFLLPILLLSGLSIGFTQSLVLRKYVNWFQSWRKASQIIYPYSLIRTILIVFVLGLIANLFSSAINFSLPNNFQLLPPTAVFGFLVSTDIKTSLNNNIKLSNWWIIANVIGWILGPFALLLSLFQINEILVNILIALSIGSIVGLAQGIALSLDLRKQQGLNNIISVDHLAESP